MTSPIASALAPSFAIHGMLAHASVAGFDAAQWTARPHPRVNHPVWILAHVNGVRQAIARNLGVTIAEPATPAPDFGDACLSADNYPTPAELLAEFDALGEQIAAGLAAADDARLARPYEPTFPDGAARSVGQALGFLISHEALHVGQLGLIRRLHGLPGMADVLVEQLKAAQA